VYPPGRVVGDLEAPVISIEEGARFNGRCTMTETGGSAKKLLRIAEKSESLQGGGTH
jgi:cytoskeletal protein CcmA (bactofilin family)